MEGVIIVAGGAGKRMGSTLPKQFGILGNLPVLGHAINAFARALPGAPLVVVLPADRIDFWKNLAARFAVARHTCVAGGVERFHSVRCGLEALPRETGLIAVHDGARPLVSTALIARAMACAAEHGTAVPVIDVVDSLREITENDNRPCSGSLPPASLRGVGSRAVDRRPLRIVQTPQVFSAWMLHEAYRAEFDPAFTDDASVIERAGHPIVLCEGERTNLKITVEEDLRIAAALLNNDD